MPIVKHRVLVGLIPAPDLEFALDGLEGETAALCLMSAPAKWSGPGRGAVLTLPSASSSEDEDEGEGEGEDENESNARGYFGNSSSSANASTDPLLASQRLRDQMSKDPQRPDPADFTPYIDVAPVALEICSPMDLVYECFVKLGLRYICVLREGRFVGLVHKKAFVKYCREVHEGKS